MSRPRCVRCGFEASGYDQARNQCSRCDALEAVVKNLIHSPKVAPANWPDADLSNLRVLIDFMHFGMSQPRVSTAEIEIFEGWWLERREAERGRSS